LSLPAQIKSTNLKPERKNAWEVGLDWRFFNNRIGIDATYYKENTKNQIMSISVPNYSGISSELINAGNIQNSGVEIALNTTPLKNRDWEWTVNFTYTKNKDKIVSLHKDVANYIILDGTPDYGNYRIASVAKVGGSYGMLMSDSKPKIDATTGLPVLTYSNSMRTAYYRRSGEVQEVGSMLPDFLGSVSTGLTYKNISLHVSLDARFGGYVASYNSRYATAYGFSGTSLKYRKGITWSTKYNDASKGTEFTDGFIPNGVFASGTTVTSIGGSSVDVSGKTYKECYEQGILEPAHLESFAYFSNSWGQGVTNDNWLKKLNYIALREVSISYRVPALIASKIGANSLALSLVGRNLGYLLNTAPNHENPESIRGTGASQFRMRSFSPYTANYMFTINASF
jgi:iron complex outermembrane recepter protein